MIYSGDNGTLLYQAKNIAARLSAALDVLKSGRTDLARLDLEKLLADLEGKQP